MKICECFKLLKVGLFVKTNRDNLDFVGEIIKIESDCIFIATNELRFGRPMRDDMLKLAIDRGYKNAVFMPRHIDYDIEILDKLPVSKDSFNDDIGF
jgi:hypothetical protein